jgi:hypothetical protein
MFVCLHCALTLPFQLKQYVIFHNLQPSQQCLQTLRAITMTHKFGDGALTLVDLSSRITCSSGPDHM